MYPATPDERLQWSVPEWEWDIYDAANSEPEGITYSRAETIAAVTDYYKFLTTMYMDDSQVVYPPAGGWPSIVNTDPDILKLLGKSDEVLSLLAHLPYIRRLCRDTSEADAAPLCLFAHWPDILEMLTDDPTLLDFVRVRTEGDFGRLANPHTIGLASGPSYYNPVIVLDTNLGIIYWDECPDEVKMAYGESCVPHVEEEKDDDDMDEEDDDDNANEQEDDGKVDEEKDDDNANEQAYAYGENPKDIEEWFRDGAAAWAIPRFFEILEDRFKSLHWIPMSPRTVWCHRSFGLNGEAIVAMLTDIYRQHGWPDLAVYDKSACMQAVYRALAESYPDDLFCARWTEEDWLAADPSISTTL